MESEDTAEEITTTTTTDIDPELDELIKTMVDVVQDFLSARKVNLHNDEPTPDGWPDESLIHGTDYDTLYNDFLGTFEQWGLVF